MKLPFLSSWILTLGFFVSCLPNPAAQQFANFGHHAADVFVLSVRKPAPTVRQPEIEAQFVQCGIGLCQPVSPCRSSAGLGVKNLLGKVQGGTKKPGCNGCPEGTRERLTFWHQPFQQIENTAEYD